MTEVVMDDDVLYRRLSLGNGITKRGKITSIVFKARVLGNGEREQSLSTDLARLTTPRQTLDREDLPDYMLCWITAGDVRSVQDEQCVAECEVSHTPQPDNDAHCDITGPIDEDFVVQKLAEKAKPIYEFSTGTRLSRHIEALVSSTE